MLKRTLGRTRIAVSEMSLGTVSIGVPYGLEKKSQDDLISEQDAVYLLNYALDKGINFLDSSRLYGCSEERIGKAFKGKRDEVVICTKSGHLSNQDMNLLKDNELEQSIEKGIQESLSSLQTDYIDVYMVHIMGADLLALDCEIIADKFCEFKRKGLARAIGVSTYTLEQTRRAIESGIWDVIQLPYNLMDQTQQQLFGLAGEKNIGIVVRSVLFKGILTDRVLNLHPKLKSVQDHRKVYSAMMNTHAPTLSDLAIKFVLSQEAVSSVLVGTANIKNLDKALSAVDGNYLDETTAARLSDLAYPEPDFLDLATWFRSGWTS